MSEMDQALPAEPHEGIDAASTKEARAFEADQTPAITRAGSGEGPPPTDAPDAGEAPVVEGTGAGDALSGAKISDEDAAEAVAGDEGPEHPGVRRSS